MRFELRTGGAVDEGGRMGAVVIGLTTVPLVGSKT